MNIPWQSGMSVRAIEGIIEIPVIVSFIKLVHVALCIGRIVIREIILPYTCDVTITFVCIHVIKCWVAYTVVWVLVNVLIKHVLVYVLSVQFVHVVVRNVIWSIVAQLICVRVPYTVSVSSIGIVKVASTIIHLTCSRVIVGGVTSLECSK